MSTSGPVGPTVPDILWCVLKGHQLGQGLADLERMTVSVHVAISHPGLHSCVLLPRPDLRVCMVVLGLGFRVGDCFSRPSWAL